MATAVLSAAAPAFGQSAQAAENTAAAEALFSDARKLVAAGRIEEACPKFAESQRLAPGAGTLLNLGICYEKAKKTASAWATFKEAALLARSTGQPEREQIARAHVAALEPNLSTLTLHVDASLRTLPGVEVRRDGELVAPAAWGLAMPLDPGPHRIEASAPSALGWSQTFDVGAESDAKTLDVPALRLRPRAASVASSGGKAQPVASNDSPGSTQRTLGFVVGGTGLAALGASTVFGLMAKAKNDDAVSNHCNAASHCDGEGLALTSAAKTDALVSTIALAAGGVAVVSGLVLVLTSPKAHEHRTAWRASPLVDGRFGGLVVGGTW